MSNIIEECILHSWSEPRYINDFESEGIVKTKCITHDIDVYDAHKHSSCLYYRLYNRVYEDVKDALDNIYKLNKLGSGND